MVLAPPLAGRAGKFKVRETVPLTEMLTKVSHVAVVLRKSVKKAPRGRPSCLPLLVEVCAIVVYGPYSIVDFRATISDADLEAVFCPSVGGHATAILMPFSDCRLGAVFRHAWRRPVRRS